MGKGFSASEDARAAGSESPRRGWRVSLNRFVWRAHTFVAGSLIVWVERLLPDRGYGLRIFSASARLTNWLVGVRLEVLGLDRLEPRQAYVFTLDREHPELAKRVLDEAVAKLGRRASVVIFPEGTRAPAGQMLPFKGGAFVFAIQEQVPVVPVALHNTAEVMPAHGYLTILGGRVVVEILDPIPTAGLNLEDRDFLKEQARHALVAALRPEDGGIADRSDLGPFAGHPPGVRAVCVDRPPDAAASLPSWQSAPRRAEEGPSEGQVVNP